MELTVKMVQSYSGTIINIWVFCKLYFYGFNPQAVTDYD
jgi:hypothetical protein